MTASFPAGRWAGRLGTLRDAVRQELVTRQLRPHLPGAPARVLDAGCGQGTQALRLARLGHLVTGLDPSAELLGRLERELAREPAGVRQRMRTVRGPAEEATALFEPASFDVVLCHGVLMYLPDPDPVVSALAALTGPGGLVSLLVRNGDALAMRPGLLGDWATARASFTTTTYRNRIGVTARADRAAELAAMLAGHGLRVLERYGVRVFTDTAADDAAVPPAAEFEELLGCEEVAGRTDPYRQVAPLLHVIAVRDA